jgi:hypothetical protein
MNLQEQNRQKIYTEISRTCMVVSFCAILSIIACNCAGCFTTDKIKADFYQQMEMQIEAVEAGEEAQ